MLKYWVWFAERKHLSVVKKWILLDGFSNIEKLYFAGPSEYSAICPMRPAEIQSLMEKDTACAEVILARCEEKKISIMTCRDEEYPVRLKYIADPPILLYYDGRFPEVDQMVTIGMVGARHADAYGLTNARKLGYQLSHSGVVIVSGIANGCDTESLRGALSGGSPVISVLGCGIDVIYPKENRGLYADVRRRGCLISEYPPGSPPAGEHFPVRNRIISGLSLGVLIVQAAKTGGTMSTARRAIDQGRDIFTFPGLLNDPLYAGNLELLKDGAYLVENCYDILKEYLTQFPRTLADCTPGRFESLENAEAFQAARLEQQRLADKKSVDRQGKPDYIDIDEILPKVNPDEARILKALKDQPRRVDDLIQETGIHAARMSVCMTSLGIKRYIKRLPGQMVTLTEKA